MNRLKHAQLKVPRISEKQPLTEDIRKKTFTDQELQTIISQRPELIAKNQTDREISRELSKQLNRSAKSISGKTHRLVKSGQLPENPNKQEQSDFSEQELQTIISQRPILIAKNLTDRKISQELSKQLNRSAGSIEAKIHNLVKSGQLPENPNKMKDFDEEELQIIHIRRQLLIVKNLNDGEISKELSKQLNRSARSIYTKINILVKSGQLPENPNKREFEGFTAQELQTIISQRPSLIAKNLADREISKELSKQLNHSAKSIEAKIRQLLKSGQLPENPNKMKDFNEEELQIITSQRPELIAKNLTDGEISRELSKLIDHPARSIETKIPRLVKSGQLPENPNKKEQSDFSEQELQTITSQRSLLIAKNLSDHEISRELSKQLNHSAGSISEKIRKLVKSGQLPENPNKKGRNFTETELLGQLTDAVDIYTGEKNE